MGIRPARDVNLSMSAGIRSALYVSVWNIIRYRFNMASNGMRNESSTTSRSWLG